MEFFKSEREREETEAADLTSGRGGWNIMNRRSRLLTITQAKSDVKKATEARAMIGRTGTARWMSEPATLGLASGPDEHSEEIPQEY